MSFDDTDDTFERLDFEILRDGGVRRCSAPERFDADLQWLQDAGYRVERFDCASWAPTNDVVGAMHLELKARLDFPDYYGENLSALNDVVGDVPVPAPPAGLALALDHFSAFMNADRHAATAVLEILANTTHWHLLFGRRFLTVVQVDEGADDLPLAIHAIRLSYPEQHALLSLGWKHPHPL